MEVMFSFCSLKTHFGESAPEKYFWRALCAGEDEVVISLNLSNA